MAAERRGAPPGEDPISRDDDRDLAVQLASQGGGALPEEIAALVRVARLVESLPDPLIDPVFARTIEEEIAADPRLARDLAASLSAERALAMALEGVAEPRDPEIGSLVALSRALQSLPEPDIDPVFADRLERMLLTVDVNAPISAAVAMAAVPAELAPVVELARRRPVLRKALVAAIAAVLLVALPVAASANATPGSPLYGLRLRLEHVHVSWTCRTSDVACGFGHLDLAGKRLTDLEQIIAVGDTHYVPPTARMLRRELGEGTQKILGADPSMTTLHRLNRELDRTTGALAALIDRAPEPARPALVGALGAGRELSGRVVEALGLTLPPPSGDSDVPPPVTSNRPPPRDGSTRAVTHPPPKHDGFGPGGTPPIHKPPPGEVWRADEPARGECVTAAAGGTPDAVNDRLCSALDRNGAA